MNSMKVKTENLIKILVFVFFSFNLFSCKNDLKVSVFEPLPSSIVSDYSKQDSSFFENYEYVRMLADSIFISKKESPEFADLDYSEVFDFENTRKTEFLKIKDSQALKDRWESFYKNDLEKFKIDSIKYLNYIKENDYHNFLEIEVRKVYEKRVWVNSYTYVDLLIKPKNNFGIRKITGYVYFLPKEEKFDSLEVIMLSRHKENAFFSFSGYKKNQFNEEALDSQNNLDKILDLPVDLIRQKYNIHFSLSDLVIDDKFIDSDFSEVPNEMIQVFQGKYSFYDEYYIKRYINQEFKNFTQFVYDSAFQKAKIESPLVGKFFEIGNQKYSEKEKAKYDN